MRTDVRQDVRQDCLDNLVLFHMESGDYVEGNLMQVMSWMIKQAGGRTLNASWERDSWVFWRYEDMTFGMVNPLK